MGDRDSDPIAVDSDSDTGPSPPSQSQSAPHPAPPSREDMDVEPPASEGRGSPAPADSASAGDASDDGRSRSAHPPGASPSGSASAHADSAWTSRRGKARCDSCRLRNLKCDRILPTCNQCRWTPVTECTYTPLPTPGAAHRGVPRCDRCRESNLKCDRAAPVCQYCRENDISDCRYTPKKRTRALSSSDQPQFQASSSRLPYNTQGQHASFMFSNISGPSSDSQPTSFVFREPLRQPYTEGPPLALLPAPVSHTAYPHQQQPFIAHSFPDPVRSPYIRPWAHPSFAPLPGAITRRLATIKYTEMPLRDAFEVALLRFVAKLMPELKETACFSPEAYATLANCLAKGTVERLSPRIRSWATCHRICSGSDKLNLLLAPRDTVFKLSHEETVKKMSECRIQLDAQAAGKNIPELDQADPAADFERIPVEPQIYDCLVYAHRGHASAVAVLMEIRRLGISSITWPMAEIFISLCPLCNAAGRIAAARG
ncbi:unnamed protein product [Mycena citricolor]|uniref:Zn(2)-C6 fungal-type domain-containing protein n=1 Tax=Mycena citricolor TaxID=2018698 RepID=A0AAD2H913_9AGAR|nr:unnamed protein product [Mycena citricolor]